MKITNPSTKTKHTRFLLTMAFKRSFSKRGAATPASGGKETVIELDKKKQVTVRQFNGVNLVDIREFYIDKDTKEKKPGKKGISLTEESWKLLLQNQAKIQDALNEFNEGGATKKAKKEPPPAPAVDKEEEEDDDFEDVAKRDEAESEEE